MTNIEFGWILPVGTKDQSANDFVQTVQKGLDAVAPHFDSAWFPDHVQFEDTPFLESWTALTYFMALQPKMKFGHIVLCQLFRNPALLAKMAASLQYMSQNRLIFGIGAGWNEAECKAYNLPFPNPGQRVAELEDALQIMKLLWKEDKVSYQGKYHQITEAYCQPKPTSIPPILIPAFQPKMMRLAAQHADWWNTGLNAKEIDKAKKLVEALDVACEEIGRDPKSLRRTAMIGCCCRENEQEVKRVLGEQKGPFAPSFTGTPVQVAEQLQAAIDIGFDYFMIATSDFPDLTTLELLAHEVLPLVNKS